MFLKWSISQIEHFSNGAILKSNISQMEQFSNGAFWGRHHQLDDSLVGQLTSWLVVVLRRLYLATQLFTLLLIKTWHNYIIYQLKHLKCDYFSISWDQVWDSQPCWGPGRHPRKRTWQGQQSRRQVWRWESRWVQHIGVLTSTTTRPLWLLCSPPPPPPCSLHSPVWRQAACTPHWLCDEPPLQRERSWWRASRCRSSWSRKWLAGSETVPENCKRMSEY